MLSLQVDEQIISESNVDLGQLTSLSYLEQKITFVLFNVFVNFYLFSFTFIFKTPLGLLVIDSGVCRRWRSSS